MGPPPCLPGTFPNAIPLSLCLLPGHKSDKKDEKKDEKKSSDRDKKDEKKDGKKDILSFDKIKVGFHKVARMYV